MLSQRSYIFRSLEELSHVFAPLHQQRWICFSHLGVNTIHQMFYDIKATDESEQTINVLLGEGFI